MNLKDWNLENVKPYYVVGAILPANKACGWSVIVSVTESGWVEVLTDFGNFIKLGTVDTLFDEGIIPTNISNFTGFVLECGEVENLAERFSRHKENILQAEMTLKNMGLI